MVKEYKILREENFRKYKEILKFSKIIIIQGGIVGTVVPIVNAIFFETFNDINYICMAYTIMSVITGIYISYFGAEPYGKKAKEYENLIFEEELKKIKQFV